ncbi:MAG: acyl-CoA dehydrogenase family protein [bacterium]|nr:acyl-CoA dehydrogenase family protein [bacterium]
MDPGGVHEAPRLPRELRRLRREARARLRPQLAGLGGGRGLRAARDASLRDSVRTFAALAAPRVDVLDERPAAARELALLAEEHLEGRRQFGRPLPAFQGLRFDLAEMDTRLRAAELLVAEAAAAVDNGGPATAEVARAKLYATETASWIVDRAVQHHGGLGVKVGQVVERLYREVRALRIHEGTSEVQKLILAKELLQRARG